MNVLGVFEAEGRAWRFSFRDGHFGIRVLPSPAAEIAGAADAVRRAPDDVAAADALGRLLFPEALPDDLPPPGAPLHVVLHDPLARVPLAAWRLRGRWLVERHPLAFAPSLTTLAAIRARPQVPAGPPVVLGDPGGDLPGAAAEARAVAAGLGVEPLLGAAATTAALRANPHAALVHLATHAGADLRLGTLRLADGALSPAGLLALGATPRLVVLSGCASGLMRGADTLFAPATLMLAAGARTTVATVRSVDDLQARAFIADFYHAGGATTPLAALARTQRKWSRAARPSAWTSFQLYGLGEDP
jgi:CHAT domain-containing protein